MKSKLIGLTGSIASGKSTVAQILRNMGYPVIDADKIHHELIKKGNKTYFKIVDEFSSDILDDSGQIDRKKLGEIVFNDEKKLKLLNTLSHNNIIEEIKARIKELEHERVIFVEIPLLIELIKENKLNMTLDEIWVVYVDYDVQLKRLVERDRLGLKDAKARIASQLPVDEKLKYADFIIENNKDIQSLERTIEDRLGER